MIRLFVLPGRGCKKVHTIFYNNSICFFRTSYGCEQDLVFDADLADVVFLITAGGVK